MQRQARQTGRVTGGRRAAQLESEKPTQTNPANLCWSIIKEVAKFTRGSRHSARLPDAEHLKFSIALHHMIIPGGHGFRLCFQPKILFELIDA